MDAKREAELERHCREIYEEYKEAFAMMAEYDRKKEEEEKKKENPSNLDNKNTQN